MVSKSFWRGHQIEENEEGWVFSDTKQPCNDSRACGACGLERTPEGHDGCIGTLPNVMNACCGHGETPLAYVQFWDRSRIADQDAIDYITKSKEGSMTLETDIQEIPQFKRGLVWCTECGRKEKVDAVEATLGGGWPQCCGYTMTIDSPEERAQFERRAHVD